MTSPARTLGHYAADLLERVIWTFVVSVGSVPLARAVGDSNSAGTLPRS